MKENQNTRQIVFVRHGQAEPISAELGDEQRSLTEKGVGALKKMIPVLKEYIPSQDKVYIWSSLLLRAVQTAEQIGQELSIHKISQFQWINGGNTDDISQELSALEPPYCVIMVGHEPDLGKWHEEMSGHHFTYKKGMCVGFEVLDTSVFKARPKWLIQPKALDKSNLQIKGNGDALREFKKILFFYLQEVFSMQQWFFKEPDDIESTHQIRVKIRSMRSLISFMKPLLDSEEYVTIQNRLRQLAQKFGHLREVDVLIEESKALFEGNPALVHMGSRFIDTLVTERNEEVEKVYEEAQSEKVSLTLFAIYDWIQGLGEQTNLNLDEENASHHLTFEDFVHKQMKAWDKKVKRQYSKTDFSDIKQIHALRISYKKIRYTSSVLQDYIPVKSKKDIKALKEMQDRLGFICDTLNNLSIVGELNEKYDDPAMHYESGIFIGYQLSKSDRLIESLEARNET